MSSTKHLFHHRHLILASYPWASRPAPSFRNDELLRFTDIGPDGTLFYSNGAAWKPVNGIALLGKSSVVIGIAPTFTGGASGAVTFGTALPRSGIKGFFYYAAASLETDQQAGFYWTEFTTTTAGTVYDNLYTPGTPPVRPATLTEFPDVIPGGTGVSHATDTVVAFQVSIPKDLMSDDGMLVSTTQLENNNHADDKELQVKLGAALLQTVTATTTTSTPVATRVWNTGADDEQMSDLTEAAQDTGAEAGTSFTLTLRHESPTQVSILPFIELALHV